MYLLYFGQTGDKAHSLGYSIGYFIGDNILFLLIGFLIIAGIFVFFLRKMITNNKRQIKN
ncbi:LPXTG cell wall anchor domain-containing protein [Salegentibacter sp. LM13S]|uniref:LPXTG cell wall anchor domain-containing protein n=1 Tax=Salegentibacter lacus TaxID=2873599 RepID=UPI001CCDE188|nr:LPXTG cell wall anchor domain-containing protein [Salegentibacter lacus]MBZ9629613.1 LPXTG cell wall anchor domain-containing protein [Salegentibacter lacus]